MIVHYRYLKSLLRHKWYVLQAGLIVGDIPIMRLIFHDISKFLPSEFIPYAHYFHDNKLAYKNDFDVAWLKHKNRNPHHWNFWVLDDRPLPMPYTYVREMIADWLGASKAYTDSYDMTPWLADNWNRIKLHKESRSYARKILEELGQKVPK